MAAPTTRDDVQDFEVDPGIKIGLDALTPDDRRAVEEAIRNKESFLAQIADPSRVFRLRPKDPYIALKVTPQHRLIYTRQGDRIQVLDLMNQGFLDRYAVMQGDRGEAGSENKSHPTRPRRRVSHEAAG